MVSSLEHNYILLGPPGSGKSTQAELLRKAFDLVHIDIGSELRAAAEQDTSFGRELNDIVNRRRELVPDETVSTVLRMALERVPQSKGILLDGAPRRVSQIQPVLAVLQEFGRSLTKAIFIEISEEGSIGRISRRYLCFGCHRPYILGKDLHDEADGTCETCGGKIGQRKDDTKEGVRKRFQIFQEETLPVIEYFEREGTLARIDGNQGADAIYRDILAKTSKHDHA